MSEPMSDYAQARHVIECLLNEASNRQPDLTSLSKQPTQVACKWILAQLANVEHMRQVCETVGSVSIVEVHELTSGAKLSSLTFDGATTAHEVRKQARAALEGQVSDERR